MDSEDRRRFILAETAARPVPFVPEIALRMADEATELWGRTEAEMGRLDLPPPFWAFAWAGGQALARFVLDHPELVRGQSVLDFAAGSGLVAIAAALAGGGPVEAAEIDPFGREAIGLNAALNGVAVATAETDLPGRDGGWAVVLAGDVFYERALAARVLAWLRGLAARGALVLVGDPGRAYLDRAGLEPLAAYEVPTPVALEDSASKRAGVWRVR